MPELQYDRTYADSAAENYQKYFVPAIGGPIAADLIEAAAIQPGDRVLDVGCGTGVVTRLAADVAGSAGTTAGLDVNPGMLTVAKASTPSTLAIEWYESSAEATPLPDAAYDVILSQMSLQFFADKSAALGEMHRMLAPGGRVVLNVPGPTPRLFAVFGDELADHISPDARPFVDQVFCLYDPAELRRLFGDAGFADVQADRYDKQLALPAPADFLWQYVHSTPLVNAFAQASDGQRAAFEAAICAGWQDFVVDDTLRIHVGMTTVTATRD